MTQQDLDASNRPILRLKTSKNTDSNSEVEQYLEQDADQANNTAIQTDTETALSSKQIKTSTSPKNAEGEEDNKSDDDSNTDATPKKNILIVLRKNLITLFLWRSEYISSCKCKKKAIYHILI